MDEPVVGLLWLDEMDSDEQTYPKAGIFDFDALAGRVIHKKVKGGSVENVLSANDDPTLRESFTNAASELEEAGATLVVGNCGYMVYYNEFIRKNISIPAVTSSLEMLPILNYLRRDGEKIGVLTFDANKLVRAHIKAACAEANFESIEVRGLENSQSARDLYEKTFYDFEQLESDSLQVLDELLESNPDVRYLIVECTALTPFIDLYKKRTAMPVFDIVSLANLMLGSLYVAGSPIESFDSFNANKTIAYM